MPQAAPLSPSRAVLCAMSAVGASGAPAVVSGFVLLQVRGDDGDYLLLLRRYYHRVADDPQGLTFKRQEPKKSELFVVNSSELCACPARHSYPSAILSCPALLA